MLLRNRAQHAARQFILQDPPTDLTQITECGPDQHNFFDFKIFPSQAQKSLLHACGNVPIYVSKKIKILHFETNTYKYTVILSLKLRSILNGASSINENMLLID
jgi:hypothetical protein